MGLIIKGLLKAVIFLLLALLAVLLLLLFVPFGYEGTVKREEEGALSVKGRLTWLFGALALGLGFEAGECSTRLSLFGHSLSRGRKGEEGPKESSGGRKSLAKKKKSAGEKKEGEKKEREKKEEIEKKQREREEAEKKQKEKEEAEKKQKEKEEAEKKQKKREEGEKRQKEKEEAEKRQREKEETEKRQRESEAEEKKKIEEAERKQREAEEKKKIEEAEKRKREREEAAKKQKEREARQKQRENEEKKEQRQQVIGSVKKMLQLSFAFLSSPEGIGVLGLIWHCLGRTLLHLLPKAVSGELRFGREDPSQTGMILGGASALGGFSPKRFSLGLTPDFEADKDYFLGEVSFRGRAYGIFFLVLLIQILVNKHFWWLLRFIGHVREDR